MEYEVGAAALGESCTPMVNRFAAASSVGKERALGMSL
jgi:hypothetical protein